MGKNMELTGQEFYMLCFVLVVIGFIIGAIAVNVLLVNPCMDTARGAIDIGKACVDEFRQCVDFRNECMRVLTEKGIAHHECMIELDVCRGE